MLKSTQCDAPGTNFSIKVTRLEDGRFQATSKNSPHTVTANSQQVAVSQLSKALTNAQRAGSVKTPTDGGLW